MTDLSPIVDALLAISPWPWKRDRYADGTYSTWDQNGDRILEPRYNLADVNFITLAPERLAMVVVGWIEETEQVYYLQNRNNIGREATRKALRDFNLTPEKFAELKRRLEKP